MSSKVAHIKVKEHHNENYLNAIKESCVKNKDFGRMSILFGVHQFSSEIEKFVSAGLKDEPYDTRIPPDVKNKYVEARERLSVNLNQIMERSVMLGLERATRYLKVFNNLCVEKGTKVHFLFLKEDMLRIREAAEEIDIPTPSLVRVAAEVGFEDAVREYEHLMLSDEASDYLKYMPKSKKIHPYSADIPKEVFEDVLRMSEVICEEVCQTISLLNYLGTDGARKFFDEISDNDDKREFVLNDQQYIEAYNLAKEREIKNSDLNSILRENDKTLPSDEETDNVVASVKYAIDVLNDRNRKNNKEGRYELTFKQSKILKE